MLERWIDILGDVNIKSITTHDIEVAMELMINNVGYETAKNYPMRRKTPCFSYGDIRRVHRIYASNWDGQNSGCIKWKNIV